MEEEYWQLHLAGRQSNETPETVPSNISTSNYLKKPCPSLHCLKIPLYLDTAYTYYLLYLATVCL